MTLLEQLTTLNPDPEFVGNPGPPPSRVGRTRVVRAGLLAGAAAALIIAGIVVRDNRPERVNVDVAAQAAQPADVLQPVQLDGLDGAGAADEIDQEVAPADQPADDQLRLVGDLFIPAIEVITPIVSDVSVDALRQAPGHYPDSAFPGQEGNVAIAGLRTTYGSVFSQIDELVAGDEIFIGTMQGFVAYEVREQLIVDPNDVYVVDDVGDNRLTLTSTHPQFSARQRIVVVADLVGEPAPTADLRLPVFVAPELETILDGANLQVVRPDSQSYSEFVGSDHPVEAAQSFLSSQFGKWGVLLDIEMFYQRVGGADLRWSDSQSRSEGWLQMLYGDGRYHVVSMTTDGIDLVFTKTAAGGKGTVAGSAGLEIEVLRPIAENPEEHAFEALVDATTIGRQHAVPLSFTAVATDNFQDVRFVVRDRQGQQVGGMAQSLLARERLDEKLMVFVEVGMVDQVIAVLETEETAVDWVVFDEWQSVRMAMMFASDVAPPTVNDVPTHQAILVGVSRWTQEREVEPLRDALAEVGLVVNTRGSVSAWEDPYDDPAAFYVVDSLPSPSACRGLNIDGGWGVPSLHLNEDRVVYSTAEAARQSAPLATTGDVVEFRDRAGVPLGFARPFVHQPFSFHSIVAVEQAPGGWILDRWELAGC